MNPHLQPWSISADDFPADSFAADQLEFLIGYAILAPSIHNTQPWLFRLHTSDLDLFADWRRSLRVADPQGRELYVSCGAALFNIRVATEYFGHEYQVTLQPDSAEPNLLARLHLGLRCETGSEDVLLFYAIPRRRTTRAGFAAEPVPAEVLEAVEADVRKEGAWLQVISGDEARNAAADLVAEADCVQWGDKQYREELACWLRLKPELQRDGIPIELLGLKSWVAFAGPALVRTFDLGKKRAAKDRESVLTSPVLAVLGTESDNPADWLAAGQALQHALLRAGTEGFSASFLNQPIEVTDLRPRLAELAGHSGFPQALLRLGRGPEVPPTPRRTVREVLLRHGSSQAR